LRLFKLHNDISTPPARPLRVQLLTVDRHRSPRRGPKPCGSGQIAFTRRRRPTGCSAPADAGGGDRSGLCRDGG
jgi:hypothetical protein